MAYIANSDFLWYKKGDKVIESESQCKEWELKNYVHNDSIKPVVIDKLDINKDGKVDVEDAKIASDVLNQIKKQNKKR